MTAPAARRVALIGGGVSLAALIEQLPDRLAVPELDLRLAAQNLETLRLMERHGRHLVAGRPGWTVTACASFAEAIDGAEVIVLLVRVGGLSARLHDDQLARRFGVPGDEGLGPGGFANALRTLPVLSDLADEIRRHAPDAWVLNLMAPLGLSTRLLLDRGLRALGVCELPGVTEGKLRVTLPDPDLPLAYAGFNHLGWFWPHSGDAQAVFREAVSEHLVDADVLTTFGAVPLKYYYWLFDTAAAARLGIARDEDRTARLIDLRARALSDIEAAPDRPSPAVAARPTPWFSDALVPLLACHLCGERWEGYANVRNDGLVAELPAEAVIEVPAVVIGSAGLDPMPLRTPVPPRVLAFLDRVGRTEELLYRSWTDVDDRLLVDAIRCSPYGLADDEAKRLARSLLDPSHPSSPLPTPPPHDRTVTPMRSARFEASRDTATTYVFGPEARRSPELLAALSDVPLVAVIDDQVSQLHADRVAALLDEVQCVGSLIVEGGEQCKSYEQLHQLLRFFEERQLPKHGLVLAIGGGTVCDVAGLAAMLIRRSVPLVLLPTTVVAQVDAAVGGKNGINSDSTKNLIGHFHHPVIVAGDQVFLTTLPERQIISGIAECIKVFAVSDAEALDRHAQTWQTLAIDDLEPWRDAIWEAARIKLDLLAEDPFENSSRRLLNYGHAFAHTLEEQSGYQLLHGEAVLVGMMIENEVARELMLSKPELDDLQRMICSLLTRQCRDHWVPFEAIRPELSKIRQMRRGAMNLVCVSTPGEATIVDDVPDVELGAAWDRTEELLRSSTPVLPRARTSLTAARGMPG